MDYQNRVGSKFGGGGVADKSETNAARRERLRKLALETIDLSKDPYFMKNHLGSFECKLCLTVHLDDGSYLAHTQGKKHQTYLARRAAQDKQRYGGDPSSKSLEMSQASTIPKKQFVKIGTPGYRIIKIRDPETSQLGVFVHIKYPEIASGVKPRYRLMSAFEQKIEPADKNFQYLVVAAEPYETIGIRLQAFQIDSDNSYDYWDSPNYYIQLLFISTGHKR